MWPLSRRRSSPRTASSDRSSGSIAAPTAGSRRGFFPGRHAERLVHGRSRSMSPLSRCKHVVGPVHHDLSHVRERPLSEIAAARAASSRRSASPGVAVQSTECRTQTQAHTVKESAISNRTSRSQGLEVVDGGHRREASLLVCSASRSVTVVSTSGDDTGTELRALPEQP